MKSNLIFKTNSIFESVTYDKDANCWQFQFTDRIYAVSYGFWRLLISNRIAFVSLDHENQFGLPQPLDLTRKVTKLLTGKKLIELNVDKETADLTLIISGQITMQIFIASSGNESYEFSVDGKRYIGTGSGDIEIVEVTENPQILRTRQP